MFCERDRRWNSHDSLQNSCFFNFYLLIFLTYILKYFFDFIFRDSFLSSALIISSCGGLKICPQILWYSSLQQWHLIPLAWAGFRDLLLTFCVPIETKWQKTLGLLSCSPLGHSGESQLPCHGTLEHFYGEAHVVRSRGLQQGAKSSCHQISWPQLNFQMAGWHLDCNTMRDSSHISCSWVPHPPKIWSSKYVLR